MMLITFPSILYSEICDSEILVVRLNALRSVKLNTSGNCCIFLLRNKVQSKLVSGENRIVDQSISLVPIRILLGMMAQKYLSLTECNIITHQLLKFISFSW